MNDSSLTLEILVGKVPILTFEEDQSGIALLASQFRDSFFETQLETAGPCLALVTKYSPPAEQISEEIPDVPSEILGDDSNYVVTIVVSDELIPEAKVVLQTIWDQVSAGAEDYLGGVLTIEGFSLKAKKSALFQILKTKKASWEQYRIHPFLRDDDGNPHPTGAPLVDDNESGPVDLQALFHGLKAD